MIRLTPGFVLVPLVFDSSVRRSSGRSLAGIGIRGNSFQLLLPASAPAGSITLFGVTGKRRIEVPLGPFGAGAQLVDLPQLAPGVYSLWVALGPFSGSAHLIHSGNRTTLMQRISGKWPRP